MPVQFLSEEWFSKVNELQTEAGSIDVAEDLKGLQINVTVGEGDNAVLMCLNQGLFTKGHESDAPANLILTKELAYKILIENDQSAGMQGFMSGELRVDGDMSKIMALQSVQPTPEQKALQSKIQAETSL